MLSLRVFGIHSPMPAKLCVLSDTCFPTTKSTTEKDKLVSLCVVRSTQASHSVCLTLWTCLCVCVTLCTRLCVWLCGSVCVLQFQQKWCSFSTDRATEGPQGLSPPTPRRWSLPGMKVVVLTPLPSPVLHSLPTAALLGFCAKPLPRNGECGVQREGTLTLSSRAHTCSAPVQEQSASNTDVCNSASSIPSFSRCDATTLRGPTFLPEVLVCSLLEWTDTGKQSSCILLRDVDVARILAPRYDPLHSRMRKVLEVVTMLHLLRGLWDTKWGS